MLLGCGLGKENLGKFCERVWPLKSQTPMFMFCYFVLCLCLCNVILSLYPFERIGLVFLLINNNTLEGFIIITNYEAYFLFLSHVISQDKIANCYTLESII